jgi:hypothetical protein
VGVDGLESPALRPVRANVQVIALGPLDHAPREYLSMSMRTAALLRGVLGDEAKRADGPDRLAT